MTRQLLVGGGGILTLLTLQDDSQCLSFKFPVETTNLSTFSEISIMILECMCSIAYCVQAGPK